MTLVKRIKMHQLSTIVSPGDVILVRDGEHGILNTLITYVQGRLLAELAEKADKGYKMQNNAQAKTFTHAMMVTDITQTGEVVIAHNYFPHCDEILLKQKLDKPGMTIAVARLHKLNTVDEVKRAIAAARADVAKKLPYSIRKLFYHYGIRWGLDHSLFGRSILKVFQYGAPGKEDDKYQVCSGSVWTWLMTGIGHETVAWLHDNDKMPEVWYPARMVADTYYFDHVGIFTID